MLRATDVVRARGRFTSNLMVLLTCRADDPLEAGRRDQIAPSHVQSRTGVRWQRDLDLRLVLPCRRSMGKINLVVNASVRQCRGQLCKNRLISGNQELAVTPSPCTLMRANVQEKKNSAEAGLGMTRLKVYFLDLSLADFSFLKGFGGLTVFSSLNVFRYATSAASSSSVSPRLPIRPKFPA